MLRWRLLSAAVLIPALLLLFWLDVEYPLLGAPGAWLVPLVVVLAGLAATEMLELLAAQGWQPARWCVLAGTVLVPLAACGPILWTMSGMRYPAAYPPGHAGWPLAALAAGVLLAMMAEMRRFRGPGKSLLHVALSVLVMLYVGLALAFLVLLRLLHDNWWGMMALVSLIVVVKMSDTGAYFTGRCLGRHKMAPLLSPGKTWEGLIGGLLAACLSSWLFFRFVAPGTSWGSEEAIGWGWLPYALIVAVAGVVGDLAESLMKRDVGRKDSSHWLPGMGGILDVLDSLLMAAGPAWLCWVSGLVGPQG